MLQSGNKNLPSLRRVDAPNLPSLRMVDDPESLPSLRMVLYRRPYQGKKNTSRRPASRYASVGVTPDPPLSWYGDAPSERPTDVEKCCLTRVHSPRRQTRKSRPRHWHARGRQPPTNGVQASSLTDYLRTQTKKPWNIVEKACFYGLNPATTRHRPTLMGGECAMLRTERQLQVGTRRAAIACSSSVRDFLRTQTRSAAGRGRSGQIGVAVQRHIHPVCYYLLTGVLGRLNVR